MAEADPYAHYGAGLANLPHGTGPGIGSSGLAAGRAHGMDSSAIADGMFSAWL